MASPYGGGGAKSADAHEQRSHNGLLHTPEFHRQRVCTCRLCWEHVRLPQSSGSSPSCSGSPALYSNRDNPFSVARLRHGVNYAEKSRFTEDLRCHIQPPHGAENLSHAATRDCFSVPCCHSDRLVPPRTPQFHDVSKFPTIHPSVEDLFRSSSLNQGRNCDEESLRMIPPVKGVGNHTTKPDQIILYNWSLIRCYGGEVSIGGFTNHGTAGAEKFETVEIARRIDKCRLVARDGLEVRLVGLIDDCTTISNGFSLNIVQSFLSGFPYIWNHLLLNELRTMQLNNQISGSGGLTGAVEMSQLSFDVSLDKKSKLLSQTGALFDYPEKTRDPEHNVKGGRVMEVHRDKEKLTVKDQLEVYSDKEEVTARDQFEAYSDKEEVTVIDQSDKEETLAKTHPIQEAFGPRNEDLSAVDEQRPCLDSLDAAQVKELNNQADSTEHVCDFAPLEQSGCTAINKLVSSPEKSSFVLSGENDAVYKLGDTTGSLDQLNGSTDCVEKLAKKVSICSRSLGIPQRITRSMHRVGKHAVIHHQVSHDNLPNIVSIRADTSVNIGPVPAEDCGAEDILHQPCIPCELALPDVCAMRKVGEPQHIMFGKKSSKSHSKGNGDGGNHTIEDMNSIQTNKANIIPVRAGTIMDANSAGSKDGGNHTTEDIMDANSAGSKGGGNHTTEDMNPIQTNKANIIPVRAGTIMDANGDSSFPHKTRTPLGKRGTRGVRSRRKSSKNCNRDDVDCGKCSPIEDVNSMANICIRTVDDDEENGGANGGAVVDVMTSQCKSGRIKVVQSSELASASVFSRIERLEEGPEEDVKANPKNSDTVDETSAGNPTNANQNHVLHATRHSGRGTKHVMLQPPLLRSRASVSTRLVSTAFGLKTSRSGRLLVPPLHYWRSQSLLRDKDGGIVAISDGFKDASSVGDGFSPPAEAGLRKLQKRLRDVAIECTTPKKKKKHATRKKD